MRAHPKGIPGSLREKDERSLHFHVKAAWRMRIKMYVFNVRKRFSLKACPPVFLADIVIKHSALVLYIKEQDLLSVEPGWNNGIDPYSRHSQPLFIVWKIRCFVKVPAILRPILIGLLLWSQRVAIIRLCRRGAWAGFSQQYVVQLPVFKTK